MRAKNPIKMGVFLLVVLGVCAVLVSSFRMHVRGRSWWFAVEQLFYLKKVVVVGQQKIKEEEILNYLYLKKDKPLWSFSIESMRQALLLHPLIKEVELRRDLPHSLEIRIQEHQEKGLVALGGLYLVNEKGDIFARISSQNMPHKPVITGLSKELYQTDRNTWDRLIEMAFDFLAAADAHAIEVTDVHVDRVLGVSAHFWFESDKKEGAILQDDVMVAKVFMGHEKFSQKLARLLEMKQLLEHQGKWGSTFFLNYSRHPEWVVVKSEALRSSRAQSLTTTQAYSAR